MSISDFIKNAKSTMSDIDKTPEQKESDKSISNFVDNFYIQRRYWRF
jgi:hypothetical protein